MWTDEAREQYKDDGRRYPSDLTDAEELPGDWGCGRPSDIFAFNL